MCALHSEEIAVLLIPEEENISLFNAKILQQVLIDDVKMVVGLIKIEFFQLTNRSKQSLILLQEKISSRPPGQPHLPCDDHNNYYVGRRKKRASAL